MNILKTGTMKLTESIHVTNGAHIFYNYEDPKAYVDNLVAFVATGVAEGHHVFVIENKGIRSDMYALLRSLLSEDELLRVHDVDNDEYYGIGGGFNSQSILEYFSDLVSPYLGNQLCLRVWAHVEWRSKTAIDDLLAAFEQAADQVVRDGQLVTVCAYDSSAVSSSLHMALMRSHEYFMTDKEIARSPLYSKSDQTVVFPSLAVQSEMQTEMDFYRQKLDFVQVISHEVRNPLTVIKAYATMALEAEPGASDRTKQHLRSIGDYVDAIDHELTHIIHTEQLLTTDDVWGRELIKPLPLVKEVLHFAEVKARTQGVRLASTVELQGTEQILGSTIGFKLILSNLLSNAVKYSCEEDIVEFSASVARGGVGVRVVDHGIGMTDEQVAQLFQKYGKLNHTRPGQGIGLYMVKMLLEYYQGTISVQSEYGKGTSVDLYFPLTKG